MPRALGLVETRGLVAAIEAADAMLKAANVTFAGKERTDPAMITIKVMGDVAAVKSSVDAGAAAAQRVGALISTHIIPQPDEQLLKIFPELSESKEIRNDEGQSPPSNQKTESKKEKASVKPAEQTLPPKAKEEKENASKNDSADKGKVESENRPQDLFQYEDTISRLRKEALEQEDSEEDEASGEPFEKLNPEDIPENLDELSVPELRKLARSIENFPIKGREISMANKQELLSYFGKII